MPGRRKLLPRPCPQCGQENGGVQIVLFNPRYYKVRTGYARYRPYILLRVGHYSKEEYRLKRLERSKATKVWHNFQIALGSQFQIALGSEPDVKIFVNEVFDQPDYVDRQSVTFPLFPDWYKRFKKNGWPKIVNNHAHWFNKVGPKKCQECGNIVESLLRCFIHYEERKKYPAFHDTYWIWLCEPCSINKDLAYRKKKTKNN